MSGPAQTERPQSGAAQQVSGDGALGARDTLTVTDNRTGATYELPVSDGTVRALELSGGCLLAHQWRAALARAARALGARGHDSHVRAREHQGLHARLPLRRESDGHAR